VVNGDMSLRRLKLSIYEVVTPRGKEEIAVIDIRTFLFTETHGR
jgi:hypothetical protein